MALVNVVVLLALTDMGENIRPRVLLVDWDIEAPGLDTYFELIDASSKTSNYRAKPGIVDLLEAQSKGESLSWRDCLNRITFSGSDLDFISSGRNEGPQGSVPDYGTRVQHLNWARLFEEHNIGNYWNQVRKEWIEQYDYILIDSRTGYTDIGDICTVLLADVLVLCFVTNYQNVRGIDQALKRARQARDALPVDRSRLIAIPVGMRDEIYNERAKALEWRGIYVTELGYLFKEWLPASVTPEEAINQLFVPYVPIVSFGERIPVLEHIRERVDPTSIGSAYVRLANLIRSRLDWEASYGGVAVEVARKGLELGIERTESGRLRSEKEALEVRLKGEKEALEAQLRASRRRTYARVWAAASVLIFLLSGMWFSFFAFKRAEELRRSAERQILAATEAKDDAVAQVADLKASAQATLLVATEAKEDAVRAAAQVADLKVQLQRAQAALRALEVHGRAGSPIYRATITPTGQFFATLQGDGVSLWDATTGTRSREYDTGLKNVSATGTSITTSPDGALLLAASFDNSALFWDVGRSSPRVELRGDAKVLSAQFSPDGVHILTASDDGAARIFDTGSGREIIRFILEAGPVASAAFSPDGTRVLTLDKKGLRVWDVKTGKALWLFNIEAGGRGSPAFSPDGTRIAAPSGNEVKIFDVATGRLLGTLKVAARVNSARFSPDGRRIVLGSDDQTARIFDAVTTQQLAVLQAHTGPVISASFSPDGTRVLTASDDRSAHLWDATSGRSLQVFTEGSAITSAEFFPDGTHVLITAFDGAFQISPS